MQLAEQLPSQRGVTRLNPGFYVDSQGAFANRLAVEMSSRLDVPLPYCTTRAERVRRADGPDQPSFGSTAQCLVAAKS